MQRQKKETLRTPPAGTAKQTKTLKTIRLLPRKNFAQIFRKLHVIFCFQKSLGRF